ncbi:MAG: multicopper oxidase domain-containing protein [Terracidiphilus sp.]|jgi:FtsP/CotA-like multicopper oxidase with cupredoxin domain
MVSSLVSHTRGKALAGLAMFVLVHICAHAQTTFTPPAVAPVPNPCPRFAAGSPVLNPVALFSSHGILSVNFSYQTTTDANGRTLYCFMTPSGLENPTLHVNPGDHLVITITNNTPAGMNPMELNPPNCGAAFMNSSSVNIHYHGTNTSPTCGQDEVIKTVVNSGQTFQYNVAFPSNEPPGLYWYHPHIHGIAEAAVLGGAAGALVVDGIQNVQPAVAGLPQQIIVLRDQPQLNGLAEGPGGCTNGVPFQDITVNNVPINSFQASPPNGPVTFTPAVLNVKPGEKQFWRVTNSSADTIMDLQVQYNGVAQTLELVGIDGVPVNSQDGATTPSLIPITHFRLPPASRVEFIVTTPTAGVHTAQFVTTAIATGVNGDCDPSRPIFNIALGGDNSTSDPTADVVSSSVAPAAVQRFAGLATAPIAQTRLLYFSENSTQTQFFMTVSPQTPAPFNPNAPPAITAMQGTVEQWTVQNRAQENHEFHLHQVHFLVQSQNNFAINNNAPQAPADTGQYLDMIEVPAWDGNPAHPYPSVTLLVDFRGQDIGSFVFHCHILNHEDLGMMNIIQVVPQPAAWNKSQTPSPAVAADTPAGPDKSPAPGAMSMPMPVAASIKAGGRGGTQ